MAILFGATLALVAVAKLAGSTPSPTASDASMTSSCSDVGKHSTGMEWECFHHVKWAKYVGIVKDPQYYSNYSGLTKMSSYPDFQCALWHMGSNVSDEAGTGHGCPKPCTSTLPQCTGVPPTPEPAPTPAPECSDVGKASTGPERECFHHTKRAKYLDIVANPGRYASYEGLSKNSSIADFQCALWHMGLKEGDAEGVGHMCPKPCTSTLEECAKAPAPTSHHKRIFPWWGWLLFPIPAAFGGFGVYAYKELSKDKSEPKHKKRSTNAILPVGAAPEAAEPMIARDIPSVFEQQAVPMPIDTQALPRVQYAVPAPYPYTPVGPITIMRSSVLPLPAKGVPVATHVGAVAAGTMPAPATH